MGLKLKIKGTNAGMLSELRTGKRMGASVVPGSGAIETFKGDLRKGGFMVECKSTVNLSISTKLAYLKKVATEARNEGLLPALHLAFTNEDGRPAPNGTWIMVRESDFMELMANAKDPEGED